MQRQRRKLTPTQRLLKVLGRTWWIIVGGLAAGWIMVILAGLLSEIPLPEAVPGAQSSKIYAADERLIGTFHGEQNRTSVGLYSISRSLRDAVVATEDRGFYTHPGLSFRGIMRAALTNFRGGAIEQGASTITQQYARTFTHVGKERTFTRKLREATLAVKIERKYSKEKILELYLNTVYFGRGAYGAEAAAQTYFKKPAAALDLSEAAYLAGIIRAPQRFQVETNPKGVNSVRNTVLGDMLEAGYIDRARLDEASAVNLASRFQFGVNAETDSPKGGYFIEYVRRVLLGPEFDLSEKVLLGGGLRIYTTLDRRMQDAAEAAVASTLDLPQDPEAALIAMDSEGHVRAMVGGRVVNDVKRARGFNFSANWDPRDGGGRQAGSAFKPFALAAFLDEGRSVRSRFPGPKEIQLDSRRCRNSDGTPWKVSNFEDAAFGTIDLIEATTKSVNTIYAQMMNTVVTPRKFMEVAGKTGIPIPSSDEGCALTLGTTDVTPLEMARAYTTFASRGRRPVPLVVTRVISAEGDVIAERKPRSEQTLDQSVADSVNWIMKENISRGTGTGAKLPWAAMGKTGTTQNHVDASFAGATPELTAVVWMGYPPNPQTGEIPPMLQVHGRRVTGGSFPATIWRKFMAEALKGARHSDFPAPDLERGTVLQPSPTPCPETPSPGPDASCIRRASPTPSPTVSPESKEPTPATPTPTSTPTPGRPCLVPLLCRQEIFP
jgi:membrane peptidoglycan carboxypeptidase